MDSAKTDRYRKKQQTKSRAANDDRLRQERDNLRREQDNHSAQLAAIKSERDHERARNEELQDQIINLQIKIAELEEKK